MLNVESPRAHVFMRVHACNLRPGRRVLGVEFVAPYLVPEFMKAGLAIIYTAVLERRK